jgi:type IV pilus assembly protein PilW
LKLRQRSHASTAGGFSLVELMVGMVIGMIAIVVVMQVFSLSEGSKRTTTGGDDAQMSGAVALTMLQRDIRQAGYGISNFAIIGCNVTLPAPATWTVPAMAPVTVNHPSIPAGDDNTDTLVVAYGNSAGSSEGDRVITQPVGVNSVYTVTTPQSFVIGEQVIAMPPISPRPNPCNLTLEAVVNVTSPSPPNVTVTTGVAGMTDGTLFNLGTQPQVHVYAVRSGALTVCDYLANDCSVAGNVGNAAVWVPIGDNIVSLRAEYGRDTTAPMDALVDTYDQTSPVGTDACGWTRISAVRLALVARSSQLEKATVSSAAPVWSGSASGVPIDLSGNANWQLYRYKTFETTVPLRNMAWQGVQSC